MTIRKVLLWHIGVLFCVGGAAAGTYHGLQQLRAQRTALGVQLAQTSAPQAAPAPSTAPAPAASPTVTTDTTPHAAPSSSVPSLAKSMTASSLPPKFWFQPLPQPPAADGHARRHSSHTVLASSHHVVRPTSPAGHPVTVATRATLPPLPQPDPRVAYYYGYPGYYPYAAGYRYYPYYPRYPYYSSY